MKKLIALVLVVLMLCACVASGEIQIGQVEYAAHGTKCFAVLTVVVDDETILAARIDEFQLMAAAEATPVPNSEKMFSDLFEKGQVLASKRVNNGLYSTTMVAHAGATNALGVNYDAIEAYVTGKTISELEAAIDGKTKEEMIDAVSSCTLADTLGYVTGLLEAAKAASLKTGYYTLYNVTGETVTEATFTDNATGETTIVATDMAPDAIKVVSISAPAKASFTFTFKTEGGYEASFKTLHVETVALTMLAADALTGATPISFFAPAAK